MQNLQAELIDLLENEDNLVVDGQLNKTKVVEAVLKVDPKLIKILIGNSTFKKHFFQDIDGVLVFDKIAFQRFVNNKSFLPDSYTAFKNKIGLTINDGSTDNYIHSRNDVSLVWPHKDCVLEGGQTKEDQKRDEIFWNETLAPDSIDRLLSPKAFTNFKKYTREGAQNPDTLTRDENLILKGNNLLCLASLLKTHRGRIKLIYIDPPYNTGSDSFLYNDNFNHSSWLTFMKNRLEIAYELLSPKGSIFVQCDENEQGYLKVLMDTVFGDQNYGNTIVVKTKTAGVSGTHEGKSLQKSNEMIHFYTKDANHFKFEDQQYNLISLEDYLNEMKVQKKSFKYTTVLIDEGKSKHFATIKDGYNNDIEVYAVEGYKTKSVSSLAKEENLSEIEIYNKYYSKIYTTENAQTSIRTRLQEATDEENNMYFIEYYPVSGKNKGEKTRVHFVGPKKRLVSWFKNVADQENDEIFKKEKLGTLWDKINWNNVTREGGVKFPNGQKPEQLLKIIIGLVTKESDIVLDFFLGSGTTAAASMKMKRHFIGIEQMDYGKNDCVIRLKNVMNGDPSGISSDMEWNGGGSFVYAELMKYNQVYIDKIQSAKTKDDLVKIWKEMETSAFLSYQFDSITFNDRLEAFKTAPVEDMKKYLVEVLDKNQLYVNYSEIQDKQFKVSEEDIKLNQAFYSV